MCVLAHPPSLAAILFSLLKHAASPFTAALQLPHKNCPPPKLKACCTLFFPSHASLNANLTLYPLKRNELIMPDL